MSELAGHSMRSFMRSERPSIKMAAGPGIAHGEKLVGKSEADAFRVGSEVLADEVKVAQCGRHQDIGLAAALNQVTGHRLPLPNHPLCGGGFVVNVTRVDVRPLAQKVFRDFNRCGEVKRGLAIAAARM